MLVMSWQGTQVLSKIQQRLGQTPLAYGILFSVLPLALGIAVGALVGFGPCGTNVPSSARIIVLAAGAIALAAPLMATWLFWLSFRRQRIVAAVVGLPLLFGSGFVCLYWFFVVISAVMSFRFAGS